MPKSLAEGHRKVAILTSAPANPAAPTTTELNAGIQAAAKILASDWSFSATDSDKVAEKSLADINNVNALGASNYTCAFTIFRFFNAGTGAPEPTEDALYTAVKVKGTTLYIYLRENGKLESQAWASTDEIPLGLQVITDAIQAPQETGGYIKRRVPCEPQAAYVNIAVA